MVRPCRLHSLVDLSPTRAQGSYPLLARARLPSHPLHEHPSYRSDFSVRRVSHVRRCLEVSAPGLSLGPEREPLVPRRSRPHGFLIDAGKGRTPHYFDAAWRLSEVAFRTRFLGPGPLFETFWTSR